MILSGKKLSKEKKEEFKKQIEDLTKDLGRAPSLHVVLVGEDPASQVYVGHKEKLCASVGVESVVHRLSESTDQTDLLSLIQELNEDDNIDGVLVQLPLPKALKGFDPLRYIDPQKDVDGLSPLNMGLMIKGEAFAEPCTPKGVIELLKANHIEIKGRNAVVIGRSEIVGWPMAWMLTREHATVTVCHSHTKDLNEILKNADIVVVAAGKPKFINKESLKAGATVIDVGIHRTQENKLVGDVDTKGFEEKEISYTPVPGGVGPMTVATLVQNLIGLVKKKGEL